MDAYKSVRSMTVRLAGAPTIRSLAFFFREKRWLFFAFAIGAALYFAPTPEGLSREGHIVLVMTAVAVTLFVSEPVPLPAVALMIVLGQVLLLGVDSTVVAQSLMSDSVLFIMGSLMLAVAVVKQKLDKRIAYFIVRVTGTKTVAIAFGIAAASGLLASVIGEHTVAAMMLPVVMTLVTLTSDDRKRMHAVAAVLLFSVAYGCAIAGIGTPSGGARNAIMMGYWREFFYDPADPATSKYAVGYLRWILYCYPIFLVQLPLVVFVLLRTFKPKQRRLARAVVKLREQIEQEGPMKARDWAAIGLFGATLLGWILFSETFGLGTIAILGAVSFLVIGLVRWSDVNSGVNWGVVLLYAAAISLGVRMQQTGAASWLADTFLDVLTPIGVSNGPPLLLAVAGLTTVVTNTMSAGAAVAVLGPVVLRTAEISGESPLVLGYITAVSSAFAYFTAAAHPAFTIIYASGYLKARDFLRIGWRMAILSIVVVMIAATVYWPLLGA
jgi:sodium-dependent dicarboxylate transporter 2/3/5